MPQNLYSVDLTTLKRTAAIMPNGAAAQALAELARRHAAGENVAIYQARSRAGSTLLVGPVIDDAQGVA